MKHLVSRCFTISLIGLAGLFAPIAGHAELHSKAKELVIMEPRALPEQAQFEGNSLFLHSDDGGSTYLYVEQQQGTRLSIFDVTDPSRIKLTSSTALAIGGAFDFVRSLDGRAELIRFREDNNVAVMDLRKATRPTFKLLSAGIYVGQTEPLGETGFLGVSASDKYATALPHDYRVVDISTPSNPRLMAIVKQVDHKIVNNDTGTTFLLGSDGLTIIRQISVENDYKTHLMQMNGN